MIPGIGSPLTAGIVYVAAAIVAALLLVIAAQGVVIWWLNGQVGDARAEYALLAEKNGRCEAEASGLKGSLETQGKAVDGLKSACSAAGEAAKAALAVAQAQRPATAKQIADILAGKPQHPEDLCRSACAELRREVVR